MANDYKTPGVYVEEISKFPPSVAGVATAIPAFVGYTGITPNKNVPCRITSLLEYEALFGQGPELSVENDKSIKNIEYVLYDSIRLFYDNGGGICYIVSVGQYGDGLKADDFKVGISALEEVDEVTLVLFPDAAGLEEDQLAGVQNATLKHCQKMADRFAILDVKRIDPKNDIQDFRDKISSNPLELRYGAAYYPYLSTIYTKSWAFKDVYNYLGADWFTTVLASMEGAPQENLESVLQIDPVTLLTEEEKEAIEIIELTKDEQVAIVLTKEEIAAFEVLANAMKLSTKEISDINATVPIDPEDSEEIRAEKEQQREKKKEEALQKKKEEDLQKKINDALIDALKNEENENKLNTVLAEKKAVKTEELKTVNQLRINSIIPFIPGYDKAVKELNTKTTLIPPSGAIAGIYSATDQYQGVWKAPANTSIASLSGVSDFITAQSQENMNIDSNAGKSVNAVRIFSGKGILVWGARTLDGNSNEWRYISVRRLFNYIEESVQKSTSWAVFSPNDGNTWIKIKSQIENFLNNLWRAGALAGSTPDSSYFVNVGLGITMDNDDIQNGLLIVEIGLAAVRPAEFIILRFSHKVQE